MPFVSCEARQIDIDGWTSAASLRSELRLLETLNRLSKVCWSPTLKANAGAINAHKLKLERELENGLKRF
jgi:hypothetical protein